MSETFPVVPLRNAVLLPGVSLPISAGRAVTLRAIEAAITDPRHRVFALAQRNGYYEATVTEAKELLPLHPEDPAVVALHREVRERAAELGKKLGLPDEVVEQMLQQVHEPGRLADLVAGYLDIQTPERQGL